MICDLGEPLYLPGVSNLILEEYGLTVWDTGVVTAAAKAGLVHRYQGGYGVDHVCTPMKGTFVRLTELGKALLSNQVTE